MSFVLSLSAGMSRISTCNPVKHVLAAGPVLLLNLPVLHEHRLPALAIGQEHGRTEEDKVLMERGPDRAAEG